MQPSGGTAAAITRNALSGGGRFVVAALVALVVTPYALHALGTERFGLWALAGALLATARVLDLGLNRALVRAVADAGGRGDSSAARRAMASGRGLALLVSVAVVMVVWLSVDVLVTHLLRLPLELQPLARNVLLGTAVVAAVEVAFSPFQSGLDGVGRMDLSNGIDTVQRVLSGFGTVVVLALGGGLIGLVFKNIATATLAGCAYWWVLRSRAPDIVTSRPRVRGGDARELVAFGRHVQAVALSALVMDVGGKLILGRGSGLDAVALYELATRVVTQVGGAVIAVAMALFPAAAEARARDESIGAPELVRLYLEGTRSLAWLAFPAFALPIVLARPFVFAWLGPGYVPVAWSIQLLSMGWLVASVAVPAHLVAQAGGRPRVSVLGAIATAGVAMALGAALVVPLGLAGIVIAVASGLVLGALVVWWRFAAAFGTGWATAIAIGWRTPVSTVVGAAGAFLIMATVRTTLDPAPTLLTVAVSATAGLVVYAAVLHVTGEVTRHDWALLRQALSHTKADGGGNASSSQNGDDHGPGHANGDDRATTEGSR